MRLTFIGDVMLGREVGKTIQERGVDFTFGTVLPIFARSNYIIANLEAPFASNGKKFYRKNPNLSFCIDPKLVLALKYLGISAVTLANNHMTDYGQLGIVETHSILRSNDIHFTGAGKNLDEALKPIILPNGLGIFAFNSFVPMTKFAGRESFGVAEFDMRNVELVISRYSSICSHFIFIIHWGIDYHRYPIPGLIKIAKKILREFPQVVTIIGHHPHLIQPEVSYEEKKIHLSLGNFIFDEPFPLSRIGAVLHLDINYPESYIESKDYVSLNDDYRLVPLEDMERIKELTRINSVSKAITENSNDFKYMDRKWIKILLYEFIRHGSIQALTHMMKTYSLSEIRRNIFNG